MNLKDFLEKDIYQTSSVSTFGQENQMLGKQPVKIGGVVLAFLKTNHERLDLGIYRHKILRLF